jgi:hypothetical protein
MFPKWEKSVKDCGNSVGDLLSLKHCRRVGNIDARTKKYMYKKAICTVK